MEWRNGCLDSAEVARCYGVRSGVAQELVKNLQVGRFIR